MPASGRILPPVAADTARAAQTLLGSGSPFRVLGDQLDSLCEYCRPYAPDRPGVPDPPAFLHRTMVTLFQVMEWLTDPQAAEAVRTRVEWKYALHLPLNHPGFQPADLCRFRQRLLADPAAWQVFQALTAGVRNLGLWPGSDGEFGAIEPALARLCALNQVHWLAEAQAQAIEALATYRPEWLREIALPHWYARYAVRGPPAMLAQAGAALSAEAVRADIAHLLAALEQGERAAGSQLPEIRRLKCALQVGPGGSPAQGFRRASCSNCSIGICVAGGCSAYGAPIRL